MSDRQRASGHPEPCASSYEPGSLSLAGAVAMGTGVMIGAGVFALTGQIAEQAGGLFPYAFPVAAGIPCRAASRSTPWCTPSGWR